MKNIVRIVILIGLMLAGCSQSENNLTEPDIYSTPKVRGSESMSVQKLLNDPIFASKVIDGAAGGNITINQNVIDSTGRLINIYADLIIPIGAYTGAITISMEVDSRTASVDFNPSMHFDSALTFHFTFTNLPLVQMGYKPGDSVKFVYIDPNGNTYPVLSKQIVTIYNQGRLKVHNAKIQHFSRYGFVRRTERPIQHKQVLFAD